MATTKLKGKLSPWLKDKRMKKVSQFIDNNKKVIDIGCDDAALLNYVSVKHYTGIDNNNDIIRENIVKSHDCPWIDFKCIDLNNGLESNKLYDVVVLSAIVEHLKDFSILMKDINNITEQDCKVIITTPIKKSDLILKIGARLGLFSKESLDEHEHYFFKKDFTNIKGWKMTNYKTFEFGLNQLIVLEKIK